MFMKNEPIWLSVFGQYLTLVSWQNIEKEMTLRENYEYYHLKSVYDNTVKRQTILLQLSLVKFTTLVQLFCQIISQKSFIDDDEDGPNTTKNWKFLLFCSYSNNITVRSQTIICKYIPCAATYAPFLLQP